MKQRSNKKSLHPENDGDEKIRNFILCLYYLNQEAKREGLKHIANTIQQAIILIEDPQIKAAPDFVTKEMLSESSYYALEFLSKFSSLSKDRQRALACTLNGHDKCVDTKLASNKKSANQTSNHQ
ncbi:MAG: hypothetical protein SFX19_06195 [Alphaproteobacteria bacterium]|nr:hypothetical protein [Alphaproteobacteria bacterium]